MKLLSTYKNGNITTSLYDDGTRIRISKDDEFHPMFAENVDVQISNRCDHGCGMCYANCTKDGEFGKLSGWKFLETLHPGTEMAINLNFPIADDLMDFLQYLHLCGVFVNATVNQDHFEKYEVFIKKLISEELIYGLGISLSNPTNKFIRKVQNYPNAVIHVINGLFTEKHYKILKNNNLKILILGYKPIGRGIKYFNSHSLDVIDNQDWLYNQLPNMPNAFDVISFDNLALEQLNVKRLLTDSEWEEFYNGDDGQFSFFINMVDGYFSKNSLSEVKYLIEDKSMDEMFNIVRS